MKKNFIRLFSLLILLFFGARNLKAEVLNYYNFDLGLNYFDQLSTCNLEKLNANKNSFYIASIINTLSEIDTSNLSFECNYIIQKVKKNLPKKNNSFYESFGIRTKRTDLFFQNRSQRSPVVNEFFYINQNTYNNFAYKFSIQRSLSDNDVRFEDSYISYLFGNSVVNFGKISRWWSSSDNQSLIISNAAEPSPGVTIANFNPYEIKNPFLRNNFYLNYEIFINKLEKNRHVKEPYLFGARISTTFKNRFNLSLYRTAQFGGENRPVNGKVLWNMLLGKDNYYSEDKKNEPGNQLAGIDFNYSFLKNANATFYSQIIGEDESGYLPSRTFYFVGINYNFGENYNNKINIEFADTGSKIDNYVYSHGIYRSGYRHKSFPIGSSLDADSKALFINFSKKIDDHSYFSTRLINADINYNANPQNYLTFKYNNLSIFEMAYGKSFLKNKNLRSNIRIQFNNNDKDLNKVDFILDLEYSFIN